MKKVIITVATAVTLFFSKFHAGNNYKGHSFYKHPVKEQTK